MSPSRVTASGPSVHERVRRAREEQRVDDEDRGEQDGRDPQRAGDRAEQPADQAIGDERDREDRQDDRRQEERREQDERERQAAW